MSPFLMAFLVYLGYAIFACGLALVAVGVWVCVRDRRRPSVDDEFRELIWRNFGERLP